jgi:SAM-dependent methyltransferase
MPIPRRVLPREGRVAGLEIMSAPARQGTAASPGLIQRLVDGAAAQPLLFDALRWVLEAGYRGERGVLEREGVLAARRVLDLGCGTGALAGLFAPDRYQGVDPNPRYIARGRSARPGYRFAVMDGRRLELEASSFDAVVIGGVVHHLPDADALEILREARRVLVPAGRLVMWEDVPTVSRWNLIGGLVHHLDEGDHIRPTEAYLRLVESVFGRARHYAMSSGVCDYVVLVAERS